MSLPRHPGNLEVEGLILQVQVLALGRMLQLRQGLLEPGDVLAQVSRDPARSRPASRRVHVGQVKDTSS